MFVVYTSTHNTLFVDISQQDNYNEQNVRYNTDCCVSYMSNWLPRYYARTHEIYERTHARTHAHTHA